MRRADRLFRLIQLLRGGRLITARRLAEALEVSERTVYRDVRDLAASGVPIDGAAGAGYVLRGGFDIPPLMFDRAELEALVLGARMVEAWGGSDLADAARHVLTKIEAVIPPDLRPRIAATPLFAPGLKMSDLSRVTFDQLRDGIHQRQILRIEYRSLDERVTTREIWPLGLHFWGGVWTLGAWCEERQDFRSFRLDRIEKIDDTERHFQPQNGRTLRDYMAHATRR